MTSALILDIILVAVFLFFIILSAKKGFVNTVTEAVGLVAAIIIAVSFSGTVAEFTYDKMIEPAMVKATVKAVEKSAKSSADSAVSAVPETVLKQGKLFGISTEKVSDIFTQNAASGTETAVKSVSTNVIRPIAVRVLGLLATLVIFVVLFFAVKLLAKLLSKVFSISVIGKVNRTLGGFIGVLKGAVVMLLICLVLSLILSYKPSGFWIFNEENINNSFVFKYFYNIF